MSMIKSPWLACVLATGASANLGGMFPNKRIEMDLSGIRSNIRGEKLSHDFS